MTPSAAGIGGRLALAFLLCAAMLLTGGLAHQPGSGGDSFLFSAGLPAAGSSPDLSLPLPLHFQPAAGATDRLGTILSTGDSSILTVPVAGTPVGVAYDSGKGEVFVVTYDNVSVINDTTNAVVATLSGGSGAYDGSGGDPPPGGIVYDPGRGEVFVDNTYSGTVSVINDRTNSVVATIGGVGYADGIAYDSAKGEIFVADWGDDTVGVIDDENNSVVSTISLYYHSGVPAYEPVGVAYDPANGEIFVADSFCGCVSVINDTTNAVVAQISLGSYYDNSRPMGLAFDSITGVVFVADIGAGSNISVINASTDALVENFSAGYVPNGVTFDDTNGRVFVANLGSVQGNIPGSLSFINGSTDTLLANVSVGVEPSTVAYDSGKVEVFVANSGSYSLSILNASAPLPYEISMTQTRTSVDVGQPVWFNTTDDGFLGLLTYTYTAPSFAACSFNNAPTLECGPAGPGNFTVSLNVTNLLGNSYIALSDSVRVFSALTANVAVSNATLWLGDSVVISGLIGGGLTPYTYTFIGLPPGCSQQGTSQIGCLPTESGNYTIYFEADDANDWSASATQPLSVGFDFTVSAPSSTPVDHSVTLRVDSAPGFGELSYAYANLPPGCSSQDTFTLTCTPNKVGNYSILVSVHDQLGDHNAHTIVVQVVPAPNSPLGLFGFPGNNGYYLVAGIALAAIAALAAVGYRRVALGEGGPGEKGKVDLFREFKQPPNAQETEPMQTVAEGQTDPAEDIF